MRREIALFSVVLIPTWVTTCPECGAPVEVELLEASEVTGEFKRFKARCFKADQGPEHLYDFDDWSDREELMQAYVQQTWVWRLI